VRPEGFLKESLENPQKVIYTKPSSFAYILHGRNETDIARDLSLCYIAALFYRIWVDTLRCRIYNVTRLEARACGPKHL
jgi:hypothetical protein